MSYKSIKEWPEDERPRERLIKYGPSSMSDAQLIAIILRTGGSGRSAMDLGMELLDKFNSLAKIEHASIPEICEIKGLGKAKAAQLKAALEFGKRMFREPAFKKTEFLKGEDVYRHFYPKFHNLKKEVFFCAMLDAKNRMIKDARVSEGSLTASVVHPREAFKDAIRESAVSVIFVHNHPSGDPNPSREDIAITKKLSGAGETIGIRVLDHIIIGDGTYVSMLEKGYLNAG